jgi:hypothetical protein
MNRRSLLRSTATLAVVAALPACTTAQLQSAQAAFSTAVSDLAGIASGIASAGVTLGGALGISPSTLATIGTDIGALQTVLTNGASAITSTGASTLANFESIFNNLLKGAASIGSVLPNPIGLALTAANALLPGIENAFNSFFGTTTTAVAPPPTAMRFASASMTPDEARTILKNPFLAASVRSGGAAHG